MAGFSVEYDGPTAEQMSPAEAIALAALWKPVPRLPDDLRARRPLGVSVLLLEGRPVFRLMIIGGAPTWAVADWEGHVQFFRLSGRGEIHSMQDARVQALVHVLCEGDWP